MAAPRPVRTLRLVAINGAVLLLLLAGLNRLARVYGPELATALAPQPAEQAATDSLANGPLPQRVPWHRLPGVAMDSAAAARLEAEYRATNVRYHPYEGWRRQPYQGEYITIDSQGLRVHPLLPGADGPTRTLWLVGGSTVWGEGVADTATLPALLQRQLGPGWRVLNLGEPSYVARQGLARVLNRYLSGQRADVVVFYDGVNDLGLLCASQHRGTYPTHTRTEDIQEALQYRHTPMPTTWMRLRDGLAALFWADLVQLAKRLKGHGRPLHPAQTCDHYNCHTHPAWADTVVHGLLNTWQQAQHLVQANGGQFLGVLQPVAYVAGHSLAHQPYDEQLCGLRESYRTTYPLAQKALAEYEADGMVDLSKALGPNPSQPVFLDFCHLSPAGNARMAQALDSTLRAQDLLPAPPKAQP